MSTSIISRLQWHSAFTAILAALLMTLVIQLKPPYLDGIPGIAIVTQAITSIMICGGTAYLTAQWHIEHRGIHGYRNSRKFQLIFGSLCLVFLFFGGSFLERESHDIVHTIVAWNPDETYAGRATRANVGMALICLFFFGLQIVSVLASWKVAAFVSRHDKISAPSVAHYRYLAAGTFVWVILSLRMILFLAYPAWTYTALLSNDLWVALAFVLATFPFSAPVFLVAWLCLPQGWNTTLCRLLMTGTIVFVVSQLLIVSLLRALLSRWIMVHDFITITEYVRDNFIAIVLYAQAGILFIVMTVSWIAIRMIYRYRKNSSGTRPDQTSTLPSQA